MVSRILFWSGFGFAVRFWQMGIEMRPFFTRKTLWPYPIYTAAGGAFGYWLQGVDDRQTATLTERKAVLLEKRARRGRRRRSRLPRARRSLFEYHVEGEGATIEWFFVVVENMPHGRQRRLTDQSSRRPNGSGECKYGSGVWN
ncbi:hypothetical protein BN1723_010693 [Verticillium longisporum]|uniref:Uncharacterized protein n=1 Tax=Verticillium longisporum TaxID=100787 RepID=A0A0G4L0I4_VERLO|nr:hypothetical protein BN1723_010693 [Verticillium longisporum]